MGKNDYEYLDEERKKLWHKVNSVETELNRRIEEELNKKPLDYSKEAKQSSKMASEYRNKSEEAKNSIIQFLDEAREKIDKINLVHSDLEILNAEITNETNAAKTNSADVKSIAESIEKSKTEIEDNIEALEEVFEDFDTFNERLTRLTEVLTNSNNTASKIETLHKSLLEKKKEFDQLYYDIFGYTEDDDETEVEGLKDKLEKAYDDLSDDVKNAVDDIEKTKTKTINDYEVFQQEKKTEYEKHKQDWDSRYISLENKIEALLPNALTAGLSSAYSEKKKVEIAEYEKLNTAFLIAIGFLVTISLIPLGVSYYSLKTNKAFENVLLDMPRLVISILPLYVPVLWVAYSSNRKMNLSKRLSEEYSHKEVLSKTFEGLSTQINNISDEKVSEDLRNKLLYNILEVSSENPGKLISDYNKSDHPLMDALDKSVQLATAFEKLEKIPGFSKLAKKMDKKSKSIVKDEDQKANKGLDIIDDDD